MEPIVKPILSAGTISLIPLQPKHAADYIRLANDPSISPRVNNPSPFKQTHFDELLKMLEMHAQTQHHHIWVIMHEKTLCGVINSGDFRKVGLFQGGYWIDPDYWGKGIAATALTLVRDYLFNECRAIRIQAMVEPDNPASMRVMEKCGYTREGLLRRFYPSLTRGLIDVYMYAIVKEQNDG